MIEIAALTADGYLAVVFDDWEDAAEYTMEYLAGRIVREGHGAGPLRCAGCGKTIAEHDGLLQCRRGVRAGEGDVKMKNNA